MHSVVIFSHCPLICPTKQKSPAFHYVSKENNCFSCIDCDLTLYAKEPPALNSGDTVSIDEDGEELESDSDVTLSYITESLDHL